MGAIERTYGSFLKYAKIAINPFKKAILETECIIHQFINYQALEILKNDSYLEAFNFFSDYIAQLNSGAVWADQDFKSSGHFFSPLKERGLYGNRDALSLAVEYYKEALTYWVKNEAERSMFYLGAAVHLVQDMTVPQHANIRLLDDHRKYENFIKRTYMNTSDFIIDRGGYYVDSIEEAVRSNARNAIIIYNKLKDMRDDKKRYYTISKFTLPLAQKTTAGCLMRFYRDISSKRQE